MDRPRALMFAGSIATIVFALTFAYPAYDPVPVLWYYPLERRWALEVGATALAMDWYGRCLLAAVVAAASTAALYPLGRRLRLRDGAFRILTAWALTATLLVMGFYAWTLARRDPAASAIEPRHEH